MVKGGQKLRKKVSILLIDDDAAIRKTLSNILEEEGYSVEAVESGEKAIKLSNERFFNMALIDIRLPDVEGTKLLERLKKTEPEMVKIIVTGYPSLQNAVEAVNKGADGYIIKPFDVQDLLTMIKKHLKRQRESMRYTKKKIEEYVETQVRKVKLELEKLECCPAQPIPKTSKNQNLSKKAAKIEKRVR